MEIFLEFVYYYRLSKINIDPLLLQPILLVQLIYSFYSQFTIRLRNKLIDSIIYYYQQAKFKIFHQNMGSFD